MLHILRQLQRSAYRIDGLNETTQQESASDQQLAEDSDQFLQWIMNIVRIQLRTLT